MLRFALIYSCAMVVAGSSLLAELPEAEPVPTQAAPRIANPEPTPAAAYSVVPASAAVANSAPRPSVETLRAKQQQLQQLQQEVGELETQLGIAPQYQVQCLMAEVDLRKLRELDPEIQWDDQRLSVVQLLERADRSQALPTPQFRAVQSCLQSTGTMKTLMNPELVTSAYRPTAMLAGGEAPRPTASGAPPGYQHFGTSLLLDVQPLGQGRVKIHATPDFSWLDYQHAVTFEGREVPAIHQRRMNLNVEARDGETSIRCVHVDPTDGDAVQLMVAITATPVASLATPEEQPQLQPIPEDGEQK